MYRVTLHDGYAGISFTFTEYLAASVFMANAINRAVDRITAYIERIDDETPNSDTVRAKSTERTVQ